MTEDPDAAGAVRTPFRPEPAAFAVIVAGAVLGAPARYELTLALPSRPESWPTGTFLINLAGAFLLGVLLAGLERRGPDTGVRRRLRLLLGTGFLGAFTTYSTLAVETDLLGRTHCWGLAVGYAAASLVGGLILAAVGLALGERL